MIKVNCQECNKEFEAQRTSAKFCSANCRVKFNSRVETPKEAQIKPETEKAVESTENETQGLELDKIANKYDNPIDKIDTYQKLDIEELRKQPAIVPNQTFDQLLKMFHDLIESNPKPSEIKLKLEQIKESAKLSNLTPRQTDSITDRCNNFLNGQYNEAKHNLKLS